MITARQLLDSKARRAIYSIDPDSSTYEALQLMAANDVGAIVILSGNELVGILTEREYARRIVLHGKTSRHTPVRETMCREFYPVSPSTSIEECMTIMTDRRQRYLPVMEGTDLVGLISIGDVVKNVIADQRLNIDHLESYITGGR